MSNIRMIFHLSHIYNKLIHILHILVELAIQ